MGNTSYSGLVSRRMAQETRTYINPFSTRLPFFSQRHQDRFINYDTIFPNTRSRLLQSVNSKTDNG